MWLLGEESNFKPLVRIAAATLLREMWRDVFLFLVRVRGHPAGTDCSPQMLASLVDLRRDSGEAGFEPAF